MADKAGSSAETNKYWIKLTNKKQNIEYTIHWKPCSYVANRKGKNTRFNETDYALLNDGTRLFVLCFECRHKQEYRIRIKYLSILYLN